MRTRLQAVVLAVGAALWLVVPVGVTWWLVRESAQTNLAPPTSTFVPVRANEESLSTDVDLVITRSEPPELIAPSLSGVVEEISIEAGQSISSGSHVLVADGVTRLAYATDRPFGRSLAAGDGGRDVRNLNSMLATLGYAHGSSSTVNESSVRGISQLARDLGAGEQQEFDPSWIIFMPVPELTVASTSLTLGAPAPSPGEVIVTGQATVEAATLVPPGTVAAPSPDAAVEGNQSSSVPADSLVDDDTVRATAPPGAELLLNGAPLPLADSRDELSADGLSALATTVAPDDVVVTGQLVTPPGDDQYVVPPAALFTGVDSGACILRRREGVSVAVPVQVIGGFYDRSVITGDVTSRDEVALSPPARERNCS